MLVILAIERDHAKHRQQPLDGAWSEPYPVSIPLQRHFNRNDLEVVLTMGQQQKTQISRQKSGSGWQFRTYLLFYKSCEHVCKQIRNERRTMENQPFEGPSVRRTGRIGYNSSPDSAHEASSQIEYQVEQLVKDHYICRAIIHQRFQSLTSHSDETQRLLVVVPLSAVSSHSDPKNGPGRTANLEKIATYPPLRQCEYGMHGLKTTSFCRSL